MDKSEILKRINELSELIEFHSKNYYVLDNPQISDFEFDALMNELKKLEKENPEFAFDTSPTRRVGGEVLSTFEIGRASCRERV